MHNYSFPMENFVSIFKYSIPEFYKSFCIKFPDIGPNLKKCPKSSYGRPVSWSYILNEIKTLP